MSMTPTVFVIDDDHAVRESITMLLNAEGIEAEAFASAEEFLASYDGGRPGCLLIDIRMPGVGGLELQRILAERQISIPAIFITGHGDVPLAGQAFKAGAFDFIEKPFDNQLLLDRVREALESARLMQPPSYHAAGSIALVLPEALASLDEYGADGNERAAMTLHAIGEAVITTDAEGAVEYLNPMAERLTGWTSSDARGQPLERVFNIVEESSRKPIDDLFSRVQLQDESCKRERHALLLGRHGGELAVEESIAPIRTGQGELLGSVILFKDVTRQRRMTQELLHRAEHDALTGLVNRREFERRLEHAIEASKTQGARHALCYLDLDRFKTVNDTVGHAAGDELLRQIATLMMAQVRERDTLARLGGDEFALLLTNCPLEKAVEIAESLVAEIAGYRFAWEGSTFQVGVSIGVVAVTGIAGSVEELLIQADSACYSAKRLGRNRVHLCQREAGAKSRHHGEWIRASSITSALEEERFLLYAQPVVPLVEHAGDVIHQELLVRLLDSTGAAVLPRVFIPAAERYGLMAAVDRWVIRTALHRYHELFADPSPAEIAINLSAKTLGDASLSEFVRRQLAETGVPAESLCFEIGEATLTQNFNQVKRFIYAMKSEGCRIALDDFGSGLSSFSHLKKLPVDYLKIEGGVVQDMLQNPVDRVLVEAINKIGHTMAMRTVAKWVESDAVAGHLKELGIDYAQGYAMRFPVLLERACA